MIARKTASIVAWLCPILLLASGCSSGKPPMNNDVQGVVKLNGTPLPGVIVQFVPDGVSGLLSASAITDSQGHFELSTNDQPGAVIGQHKVLIIAGRGNASRANDPQAPQMDATNQAAPAAKAIPRLPSGCGDLRQSKVTLDVTADKHNGYDVILTTSG